MSPSDPLTDSDETGEYAVDAVPSNDHVDTVLADGFRSAVVNALSAPEQDPSGARLYDVIHMASGEQRRVKLTDELESRIAD